MLDDIVIVTLKKVEPLQLPLASREGRRTHRTTDPVFEEGKKGGTVPTAWNARHRVEILAKYCRVVVLCLRM